ncbi:MAG: hypothetical protein ACOCTL_01230 [Candidatus Hadarchaeota archaeon]
MTKDDVERAIENYNKYRSPRATADLIEFEPDEIKVLIKGSFCRSCGMEDYFIDLVYELERQGIDAKYMGFEPKGSEKFLARYDLKNG